MLMNVESFVGDARLNNECRFFSMELTNMRIDNFTNDDHCKSFTRLKKHKLRDLIGCLDSEEHVIVHRCSNRICRFHCKKSVICYFHKLEFANLCSFLADFVFGRDNARWGSGCNFSMRHLDKSFCNLRNTESSDI